jgi:ABC-type phosphate/phosphonate transport system permease subunit
VKSLELERDIFAEAPERPLKRGRSLIVASVLLVIMAWSFQGAKIRLGELIEGVPQIFSTLGRMLPPDFAKITEAKNYYFPENLSLSELILLLPVSEAEARARQRWWDNTFPQTVVGAT